jgi:hypothetical protein
MKRANTGGGGGTGGLGGGGGSDSGSSGSILAHPDRHHLIPQLLLALAAMTECARGPGATALDLLSLAWAFCGSPEPATRRAALVALGAALAALPLGVDLAALAPLAHEVASLARAACRSDPDEGCREAAARLLRTCPLLSLVE